MEERLEELDWEEDGVGRIDEVAVAVSDRRPRSSFLDSVSRFVADSRPRISDIGLDRKRVSASRNDMVVFLVADIISEAVVSFSCPSYLRLTEIAEIFTYII